MSADPNEVTAPALAADLLQRTGLAIMIAGEWVPDTHYFTAAHGRKDSVYALKTSDGEVTVWHVTDGDKAHRERLAGVIRKRLLGE